ncbi:hypothetical protein [Stenotrophomonas maltophilia]|uniref:hypothetical protein n=1 Tax=Stenotrophomonas maltophilia TaxID=40324 RepID=UPI00066B0E25|nr:hypothetical protein [Stenotrophomonas maltophilia]
MQEAIASPPPAHATCAAVIAAFHLWHQRCGTIHALARELSSVPGHVASFDLDYAEGDCAGLSIFEVDIHRGREQHYIGVLYGESAMSMFLYGPRTFTLSAGRDESADYDSDQMLSSDPRKMDELDAVGMFHQVPKCRPRQLATLDLAF